jgi:hypothetical protein
MRSLAIAIPLRRRIARAGTREIPTANGTTIRHGLLGELMVAGTAAEIGIAGTVALLDRIINIIKVTQEREFAVDGSDMRKAKSVKGAARG